jgi:hypothetical protein
VLGQTDPAIKAAHLDPATYYTNDFVRAGQRLSAGDETEVDAAVGT